MYGETATTKVYHQPGNGGYDCLAWGALSSAPPPTRIRNDGLPDGLEDSLLG